jgi:hypothetical protein
MRHVLMIKFDILGKLESYDILKMLQAAKSEVPVFTDHTQI